VDAIGKMSGDEFRASLVRAGIITPGGALTPAYAPGKKAGRKGKKKVKA